MALCALAASMGHAQVTFPSEITASEDDIVLDLADESTDEDDLRKQLEETSKRLKQLEMTIGDMVEADAEAEANAEVEEEEDEEEAWFEKYSISGYTQFRINEILDVEPGSADPHHAGDGSVRYDKNFFIRRARVVLQGDVTDHISIYFQPDFASNVPGSPDSNHYVQVRDWYSDIYFDDDRVYRVRVGQSKIPYGWENLQSSRNRLPLDRNDGLNSAVQNERDLGALFYWTPKYAQDFFKYTVDSGLKGSGNYGMLGFGWYNGQGGSLQEQNDNIHFVTRLTVPICFPNGQLAEVGVQGYTGRYTVLTSPISPIGIGPAVRPDGGLETGGQEGLLDQRIAGSLIYYPQPFGFQSEWNVGRGPSLNDEQTEIVDRPLYGGYGMLLYRIQTNDYGDIFPFFRYSYYKGGYKWQRNAPFARISEWELGTEWQMTKNLEFVTMYTWTDRTNLSAQSSPDTQSYEQFVGDILRFQLQVLY